MALFALMLLAIRLKQVYLQPVVFALYGITSLLFAIFEYGSLTPIFMIRYFFYLSGAFMTVVIPFFLLLFALLVIQKTMQHRNGNPFRYAVSVVIVGIVLAFTAYTVWMILQHGYLEIIRFMGMYVYIAMYLIATFISYVLLNLILKFWPKKNNYTEIIVLGAKIDDEGVLSETLRERLELAVNNYLANRAQEKPTKIFVTGGSIDPESPTEAEEMAGFLLAQGIPAEDIVCENRALNTDENFYFTKQLLENPEPVLVVTSSFHLIRTHFFAWQNQVQIEMKGARSSVFSWGYSVVREYLAFFILTKEINFICMISLAIYSILQVSKLY